MSYEKLIDRLAVWRKNLKSAKERGDTTKARKYQAYITECEEKLRAYEGDTPRDALEGYKEIIGKLQNEINDLKIQIEAKIVENTELETELDNIRNPIDTTVIDETENKKECPNCHRWFEKDKMVEHQQECIKTQAT